MSANRRAAIEVLESRRMMDATATLAEGILTVTGTEGKDAIVFSMSPGPAAQLNVKLGKSSQSFAAANITSVVVNSLGGADKITVLEKDGPIYLPFTVDAGAGNDVVATGSGNDVILGGGGNDKITSGAGDDQINGGDGNDKLAGGGDNDLILAGAGKDKLAGGTGDDNLDGGGGKDALSTGSGSDDIAVDDANAKELKDKPVDRADDAEYAVTPVTAELEALHEMAVPGSIVSRVELQGNFTTIYYRFGTDPQVYRTVLDLSGEEPDLVSREISLQELRQPARDAFEREHPGIEILSVFQHSGNQDDVRYRDADGAIKMTATNGFIWGLDDAESDLDNDGLSDQLGRPESEGTNIDD